MIWQADPGDEPDPPPRNRLHPFFWGGLVTGGRLVLLGLAVFLAYLPLAQDALHIAQVT